MAELQALASVESGTAGTATTQSMGTDSDSRGLQVVRDQAWRERSAAHVTRLLRKVTQTIITHDAPRVRLALVECAQVHLRQCPR